MRTFAVAAPAKVNLTLHVLARRQDGFHELVSLFLPLSLADRLEVRVGVRRTRVHVPGRPDLDGDDNLCARAAAAFERETGLPGAVRVRLEKRIPVAAGLGGGSSDAAAVLRVLARVHGLAPSDDRLERAALAVGSDVPFFLRAQPAVARGRGELLEPAPPLPDDLHVLIVKPPFGVSAGDAYRTLARARTAGTLPHGHDPGLPPRVRSLKSLRALLHNDLEAPVEELHPAIRDLRERLDAAGAGVARMSGSGSCVFAIFDDAEGARLCRKALVLRPGEEVFLARALRRAPFVREYR